MFISKTRALNALSKALDEQEDILSIRNPDDYEPPLSFVWTAPDNFELVEAN
jgi:hypothetical protein